MSLGFKFVLLVVGILSVTLGGTTYRLIADQREASERNLRRQGTAVGRFAALIAPQPVLAYDFIALDDIVREIRSHPDVADAMIRDPEGEPLTSTGGAPAGSDSLIRQSFPITHDGNHLGDLEIALDRSRLDQELAAVVRRQVLFYGLIVVFLSACIVAVFRQGVLIPVRALILGASRMADNDFSTPVPVSGRDEMGRLCQAFNAAMADLRVSHRQLEILSRAMEQSPAAVVITDATGVIQYVNPKFEAVSGYRFDEVVGRTPSLLKSGETSDEAYRTLWATILSGRVWRGEFHNRRKDGELFWEAASIAPVVADDGSITHFVAVKEDITRAKAERAQLDQTLDEYALSNAELERFAYIASHDLQEPLRTIMLYGQLLDRRAGPKLDPEEREFLGFMVWGAKRMSELVRDLLAYSRTASRDWAFAPVALEPVLDTVLANLRVAVDEAGAEIRRDVMPAVLGDESQLVQLFQNLIANGIKFRLPDRPPVVRVAAEREGDFWRFRISDNGIGIDPIYGEQIFTIFKRLHTADRYPGTGIGLALCRRIVERHGGEIALEPRDGEGSTFTFTLPAAG